MGKRYGMAGRRWRMRGLFKRKGSDIWQGRFRVPEEIWRQRGQLIAFGVKDIGKAQEFGRSTSEQDRDAAGEAYRAMLVAWDVKLDAWRALLDAGPQALSHKQQVALAADYAKTFLATHEDDPFAAPPEPSIPEPSREEEDATLAMVAAMEPDTRQDFKRDLREYLKAGRERRRSLILPLIGNYPGLKVVLGTGFAAALEAMHGDDIDAALEARGLHIDTISRRLLSLQMADFMGAAERGLEARRGGDYSPVRELEAAPRFIAASSAPVSRKVGGGLSLEGLLDHKAKTTSIRAKTVRGNRSYLRKFAAFIGHDDARKVTKDDVRRWRESLVEAGLTPKTITDKYLSAVRSVLSHGVKEFDLPANVASGIADNRAAVAPERSKAWSEEEAVQILQATFGGSSKALSQPHKRALFWLPWMLAYTGLRATEAAQFQGRHLREEGGVPYLLITPADGSTKSGKAWAVGIHKHLIELGFLEFIREAGGGPLFYEPYPANTDLAAIHGKSRALEASGRVAKWITEELKMRAPLGRPLHAFRHLYTTRSRACGMDKEARDFMMGSGPMDARESYGDWPPSVLDAATNKLPRFEVKDTGWRP